MRSDRHREHADASAHRRSFVRFVVAGSLTTAASYALFVILEIALPYLIAYAIAYAGGIVLSYLLNTGLVFRVPRSWSTFARFPLVYALQFVLSTSIIVLLVERFAIEPRIAAAIALVITVPVTYLAMKIALRVHSAPFR